MHKASDNVSKSWIFRYMRSGRAHNMGLGSIHVVSLAEARLAVNEAQKQLHHGIYPLQEKKKRKARSNMPTFKEGAATYIEIHRPKWKNPKHATQWSNTLRDYAEQGTSRHFHMQSYPLSTNGSLKKTGWLQNRFDSSS